MQFKIITIGKIKNKSLSSEIEELKKRISRIEIIELKEVKDKNPEIIKKKEFELIKPHINPPNHNFLLWEHGKTYSTQKFHDILKKTDKHTCFIITGAFGPSIELKQLIQHHLSLSEMTFTHEQALYMLIEQLYRVECLEKGINYTK